VAPAAPNVGGLSGANNAGAASASQAQEVTNRNTPTNQPMEVDSTISVEVVGYGGGEGDDSSSTPGAGQ
jgi:hypothetical protein